MDRKQFLSKVREEAGLENLRQADRAVRVVVGVLKTLLPEAVADQVTGFLPEDLRLGWEAVAAYPADIFEREDMFFEGVSGPEGESAPTVTEG
jgi:uncharacterized protein (DUF2267 family)